MSDQTKVIAACRDCGYVHAAKMDDYEPEATDPDDPGFRHYDATGHRVGEFEPTDGTELDRQWAIAYGIAEGDLRDAAEIYELATGVPAEADA